jgi:Ca-activated chloride channel homolog
MNAFDSTRMDMALQINADRWQKNLESLSASTSKLDLRAPNSAHHEYEKGARLLIQKSFGDSIEHLKKAVAIYPEFVTAHNALGSAYLNLGQNEQARAEFSEAVALDGHMPYSYLNLGWAQLALKNFPAAQQSMQSASKLAPLDLHLLVALTYAELLNNDYGAVITTAHQVHGRKHEGAAMVHYFAAASYQAQSNLQETKNALETFLVEAPTSPLADTAQQMIARIKDSLEHPPAPTVEIAYSAAPLDPNTTTVGIPTPARTALSRFEQQKQLEEVEAESEPVAEAEARASPRSNSTALATRSAPGSGTYVLHSNVNEVAVFFAATDHGEAVSNLARQDVVIRDAGKPPAVVTNFRNESELPLRLGLVIDTSASITTQFAFEQKAAAKFLNKSLTGKNDLAFVVGFSSAVLLVQDLTGDRASIDRGIDELAAGGGTSLWDAVKFASDKLGSLAEERPVAKILVVISDGEDNSSSATMKEAIESAERQEVIVYTVSTREFAGQNNPGAFIDDRTMRALAARTGGAAFFPGSLGNLDRRLSDLQQVIRSRYLVSYKPAQFEADGSYRTIAVSAQKSGHKLRIYARRGYYAPDATSARRPN